MVHMVDLGDQNCRFGVASDASQNVLYEIAAHA